MESNWLSSVNTQWTLFLDRDGVINRKLEDDYVKHIDEFDFLPRVLEAMELLSRKVGVIVIVTNQQGVGKGLMSEEELLGIHQYMLSEIFNHGGRVDAVFYCPYLAEDNPPCRKPNTEMAFEAKKRFPEIDFRRSFMVGDAASDMEFADRMGMKGVRIGHDDPSHLSLPSLFHVASAITSQ